MAWSTLPMRSFRETFVRNVRAVCSIGGIVSSFRDVSTLARFAVVADLACCFRAPFNISLGGMDRNLDDVQTNDSGELRLLSGRGETFIACRPIGQSGNCHATPVVGQDYSCSISM